MKDFCKKLLDVFKKPLWLLCLGLGIVLFSSIFANMANTSFYQVSVTEVSFETETADGQLTGLLYRPRSCTADNPCATIVTTHGYLNSKEMQDAPAVELSKRGYVVLALDMYEHGDSTYTIDSTSESFNFFIYSQYDAVKYMYDQDYVLKAADGTGMIAVSGHSMGGFSSRMAAMMDTYGTFSGQPQRIAAVLAVGADFRYTGEGVIDTDKMSKRTVGTIGGKYDEFFFLDEVCTEYDTEETNKCVNWTYPSNTVVEKDWTKTLNGAQFYYGDRSIDSFDDFEEFESGEWNETSYGGAGSVIYVPNEIHPWNHFSVESTGYMIDFYDHAFEKQFEIHTVTENDGVVAYEDGNGQTWWLKEGFNLVGLVGIFLSIVASIALFAKLPFFNKVVTSEEEINEVAKPTGYRKWIMNGFLVLSCVATAYVYPMISLGNLDIYVSAVQGIMWIAALVFVGALIASVVVKAVKGEDEKASKVLTSAVAGSVIVFAAAFFANWTLTRDFFSNFEYYNEEMTNQIGYWVLVATGLNLIALTISHFVSREKDGYTCANYGLKANWKQILMALLIAVCVVVGVYAITFLVEFLLRVDFRIWTYAIKPFGVQHFVAFLKYLPVFFLFYLVNSVVVVANTGEDKTWKGTLKAILINALPLAILLGVHYGMDFVTGTAKWPGLALDMILVWALVPTMALAAWITRKSYAKTGNIWTAVFINSLLFTMMQVANTILHIFA